MSDWLSMGGYGFYVWSSYALFMGVLVWDALAPALRERAARRRADARARREASRRTA